MKIRRMILFLAITTILLSCLAACGGGGGGGDVLKGKWVGPGANDPKAEVTWVFDGNGKAKLTTEFGIKLEGEYTIDGDGLVVTMGGWEKEQTFKFTVDGNNLVMVNDHEYQPSYDLTKK